MIKTLIKLAVTLVGLAVYLFLLTVFIVSVGTKDIGSFTAEAVSRFVKFWDINPDTLNVFMR
jgi:hypothetical protein